MSSRITLLAIRVRSRVAKEAWQMMKMLTGFILGLATVAGCQVGVCKYNRPKSTVMQCIAPLWRGAK